MKIKQIKNYNIPEQNFLNKLLNFFAPFLLIPFGLIMLVIVIPCMWLNDKIKRHIFKIKPNEFVKEENILFKNQIFKLVKEYYDTEDYLKEGQPLYEFFWDFVDDEDEFQIFKIKDHKKISELNDCYITDFKIDLENEIVLQLLKTENERVETFLIVFNKHTGRIEIIKHTDNFIMKKFNKKENKIIGYNKTQIIEITLEF